MPQPQWSRDPTDALMRSVEPLLSAPDEGGREAAPPRGRSEGYLALRAFRRSRPDERARVELAVVPDTGDGEGDLELGEERS